MSHIIVRGGELFSYMEHKDLIAVKLKSLLIKKHEANSRHMTTLLHPNPLSFLALEIGFQPDHSLYKWSEYIAKFHLYLNRSVELSLLYFKSTITKIYLSK